MSEVLLQWVHNLQESRTPPRFVGSPVPKITLGRHHFLGEDYQNELRKIKKEYDRARSSHENTPQPVSRNIFSSFGISSCPHKK